MVRFSIELEMGVFTAIREAKSRRHEFVSLEHLLYVLLFDKGTARIIRGAGGDVRRLREELNKFLKSTYAALPEGTEVEPERTVALKRVLHRAYLHVQLSSRTEVTTADVLVSLFQETDSHALYFLESHGVTRLKLLRFISHGARDFPEDEEDEEESDVAGAGDEEEEGHSKKKRDPLAAYTTNMIERAKQGEIDPLIGRERELERTIQILGRRRKNNPIFIGDPGVGKTALAEGLALRIARGEVPDTLRDAEMFCLDLGGLLAGTKFRGQFEERIKGVIAALEKREHAILFIDEIHQVVGAGATSSGTMDASNLLKPSLAAGKLRCIGSTTYQDFKQSFGRDRALERRFQKIELGEPTVEEAKAILHGVKKYYEAFHNVFYGDDAIDAAVTLAAKHVHDRCLPDKAIDVIDEAGSALRSGLTGARGPQTPASNPPDPLDPDDHQLDLALFGIGAISPRSTGRISASRTQGSEEPIPPPLHVTAHHIEEIVARMAKIPARTVSTSDKERLASLRDGLRANLFGQDHAIDELIRVIMLSRAGLTRADKPVGSFLLAGPTGVGKTELARQLADQLGVEFIRLDMSEYMEKHAVARLIGAPPGYVGFDQGGLLTDAVHKTPHCVVLLDEIEKAHPEVFNILLQIMDHASLTDNNGRKTDFSHAVVLMSTNAGARDLQKSSPGFASPSPGADADRARSEIERIFSPEFRNRLDGTLVFNPLDPATMTRIVDKFARELQDMLDEKGVRLELDDKAVTWLAEKGYDPKMGARPLARLFQTTIKQVLAEQILFGALARGGTARVSVGENGELSFHYIEPAGGENHQDDEISPIDTGAPAGDGGTEAVPMEME